MSAPAARARNVRRCRSSRAPRASPPRRRPRYSTTGRTSRRSTRGASRRRCAQHGYEPTTGPREPGRSPMVDRSCSTPWRTSTRPRCCAGILAAAREMEFDIARRGAAVDASAGRARAPASRRPGSAPPPSAAGSACSRYDHGARRSQVQAFQQAGLPWWPSTRRTSYDSGGQRGVEQLRRRRRRRRTTCWSSATGGSPWRRPRGARRRPASAPTGTAARWRRRASCRRTTLMLHGRLHL